MARTFSIWSGVAIDMYFTQASTLLHDTSQEFDLREYLTLVSLEQLHRPSYLQRGTNVKVLSLPSIPILFHQLHSLLNQLEHTWAKTSIQRLWKRLPKTVLGLFRVVSMVGTAM
jgi:hypothetical protein